jgi:Cu+-exporting ATPase
VEFNSFTGEGVEAVVKLSTGVQERLRIGKAEFVLSKSAEAGELPQAMSQFQSAQMRAARTVVFVSIVRAGPIPVLALALADSPKPSSAHAIAALQRMGIIVTMLTGDAEETAKAVAREVGIDEDEVYAGVSPKGKAKIVRDLMERDNGGVAMVSELSLSASPLT